MLETILISISLKFFFFDFYLFKSVVRVLPKKLQQCPFCQGFWTTLFCSLFLDWKDLINVSLLVSVMYGFIGAYICFLLSVLFDQKIDEWEERKGVTLTKTEKE